MSNAPHRQQEGAPPSALPEIPGLSPWETQLAHEVNLRNIRRMANPEVERYEFGRFEGITYKGRGGFGLVFVVFDPKLGRRAALKLSRERGPAAVKAIIREAKRLARVSHRNVVTVYDTGIHDGRAFIVMELIENCRTALDLELEDPRPTWEVFVDVYRGVAAGIIAAHDQNIVHNDIKPQNVLLDQDNWPWVADFGLAQTMAEHEGDGKIGGTLPFMAPEVIAGEPSDERSDQYSFGAALWQGLDGVPPYYGKTGAAQLEDIRRGQPMVVDDGVPQAVRDVLRRALSLDPSERYPSMRALLEDLDSAREASAAPGESGSPTEPSVEIESAPEARGGKTRRWATVVGGVLLLLFGVKCGQWIPDESSGGDFVEHVVDSVADATAATRAVSLARGGDRQDALRLLQRMQLQPLLSKPQARSLALASQVVAAECETHGEWQDAEFAWILSILFAREADDQALWQLGLQHFLPVRAHMSATQSP